MGKQVEAKDAELQKLRLEIAELEQSFAEQRAADEITAAPGELGAAYNTYWTTGEKGRRDAGAAGTVNSDDNESTAAPPSLRRVCAATNT